MTDTQIIQHVLAGDIDHYALLVHKYQEEVIKVVSAMLFSHHESEDLVQQTFLKAYEKLEQFDEVRDFKLWIKAIARNTVRMHLRKYHSRDTHMRYYRDWVCSEYEEKSVEQLQDLREAALKQCCQELPEHSLSLLTRRYGQRIPIRELALERDRSVEAITKSLSRIRLVLKSCVEARMVSS